MQTELPVILMKRFTHALVPVKNNYQTRHTVEVKVAPYVS